MKRSLCRFIEPLHLEFRVPREIVAADDDSTDRTWEALQPLKAEISVLRPIPNPAEHGFGRAIVPGPRHIQGDAVAIMMADESDDARNAGRHWKLLNEGRDVCSAVPQ